MYFASLLGFLANIFNESGLGLGALFSPTWAVLYGITLIYLVAYIARTGAPLRAWFCIYFGLYVSMSPAWSALTQQSIVYSIGLTSNTFFAVMVSLYMTRKRIVLNLRWAMNAMLLAGLIGFFAGYPGAQYYDGLQRSNLLGTDMMQGMFTHKNFLSVYAAVGFALNLFTSQGKSRVFFCAIAVLSVLLAGSSTGLVALMIIIATALLMRILQSRSLLFIVPLALSGLLVILIFFILDPAVFFVALGRDATLTGRTELWAWAVKFFLEKPVIGWGYGGIFANSGPGPSDMFVTTGYIAPHFHNGFLQVLAETGVVGFTFMVVFLLGALSNVLKGAFRFNDPMDRAILSAYVGLLGVMFAINILMRYNDLTFVLILLGFLARSAAQQAEPHIKPVQQDRRYAAT